MRNVDGIYIGGKMEKENKLLQNGDIEFMVIMIVMGIPIVTFLGIMLVIYNLLEKFFNERGNEYGEHDLL